MSQSICPVCNGLGLFQAVCPACRTEAEDLGRLGDYYGPYSPYRPIDDIRMTNGFSDVRDRLCLHNAYCGRCNSTFIVQVTEIEG